MYKIVAIAPSTMPTIAAPTPMPACAPVDRPPDDDEDIGAGTVPVEEVLEDEREVEEEVLLALVELVVLVVGELGPTVVAAR